MEFKNKFCMEPWRVFECGDGYVKACCWTPMYPCPVPGRKDSAKIWNLPALAKVRRSIIDGSFKYCDKKTCTLINGNLLISRKDDEAKNIIKNNLVKIPGHPRHINFSLDKSCNLSCPYCRSGVFNRSSGRYYTANKRIFRAVIKATIDTTQELYYSFAGTGEPFASRIYREFLWGADLRQKSNIKIKLNTNGLLFTPLCFRNMSKIHGNLSEITVALDAATEKTYKLIKKGGSWRHLMANLAYLSERKRKGVISSYLQLNYLVQKNNYKEMAAAKELADGLGYHIVFLPIREVNKSAYFSDQLIWKKDHPLNADFRKEISRPVFKGMVLDWRLNPDERARDQGNGQ